jgi:hypothetical protein
LPTFRKAKDDLSINIASSYLQALLDKELCKVAQESGGSQPRAVRPPGTSMEEAGQGCSPAEVAEARSNVEQYKLSSRAER